MQLKGATQAAEGRSDACSDAEWALRVDLAAAFRLAAQFDWTEAVGNHFSAGLSLETGTFLMSWICRTPAMRLDGQTGQWVRARPVPARSAPDA